MIRKNHFYALMFSALLLGGSFNTYAQSRSLDLSALSATSRADLLKEFPKLSSSDWTIADLDIAIKHLVSQENFDSAAFILVNGSTFKLRLGKTQRISNFRLVGDKSLSSNEIRKEFGFSEKSTFDQQSLIEGGERVRQLYISNGYRNALIDLVFTRTSDTEFDVTMQITENEPTKITRIMTDVQNPILKKCLTNNFDDYLDEVLTPAHLNEIREEAKDCFSKYKTYRAELTGPNVNFTNDEKSAELTYKIDDSIEYDVDYEGNRAFSSTKLNGLLNLQDFSSSNPSIGAELTNRLKEAYLQEGYARVEAQYSEEAGSTNFRRRIIISIVENYRFEISRIEINGRISQPSEKYAEFIKEHSSELIQKNYYNRGDIDTGLSQLLIDRRNNGYLQAKIVSTRTLFTKDKPTVTILVNLDEGPLTKLRTIQFVGNKNISSDLLLATTSLVPNDNLRSNLLDDSILQLKSYYREQGYLEMALENEKTDLVQYNQDNTVADVVFRIYEGPRVLVAGIIVEGNTLTRDYVVLKELDFAVGEVLTPAKVEESIRRLQRLGHFNSVDVRTLEERTQISERTVVVRVSDRDPGIFNAGIGANNERKLTLRGYTGVAYRNFLGTGRGVSVRAEGNYNVAKIKYLERKVTMGYLEPYLFDTRVRGKINFTTGTSVSDFDQTRGIGTTQLTFSVEQDITSHILGIYDLWSISTVRDFNIDPSSTIPETEQNIGTTGPTVEIDYRDHPFNPSKGTFTRINFEYASPKYYLGSSPTIEYFRSFASFTHYWGIGRSGWVWANSVRGGYLKNLNNRDDGGVPYEKKGLILGGQTTIRGFEASESFPNKNDLPMNSPDGTSFLLKTEAQTYLVKSELRFPIKGNIGGAFFYDGGAVLVQGVSFTDSYRDSVGIGMRYITPVGAVSIDVGYKLDRRADRDESQFPIHFSIGTF